MFSSTVLHVFLYYILNSFCLNEKEKKSAFYCMINFLCVFVSLVFFCCIYCIVFWFCLFIYIYCDCWFALWHRNRFSCSSISTKYLCEIFPIFFFLLLFGLICTETRILHWKQIKLVRCTFQSDNLQ